SKWAIKIARSIGCVDVIDDRQHRFKHRKVCVVLGNVTVTFDTASVVDEFGLKALQVLAQRGGLVLNGCFCFGFFGFIGLGTCGIEDIFDLGQGVGLFGPLGGFACFGFGCFLVAQLTRFGVHSALIGETNRLLI